MDFWACVCRQTLALVAGWVGLWSRHSHGCSVLVAGNHAHNSHLYIHICPLPPLRKPLQEEIEAIRPNRWTDRREFVDDD